MFALFPNVLKLQRTKALKINVFDYPCHLMPPLQETPAMLCINLILPENRVIGLYVCCCCWLLLLQK